MQEPPIPDDEEIRLALLRACRVNYTEAEQAFDDVAALAAQLCDTEIALITLVDADYQWFKARVGVEQAGTPRDLSFCGHCINHAEPFVVEDTHQDPRFRDNPLVTGEPFLRFYVGVPLQVDEGSSIGALSVASRKPRSITPKQLLGLQRLAAQVTRELRLRRDLDRASGVEEPLPVGPGTVVADRWAITRELGRGGAGAVFEAVTATGERAAIKVLHPRWRENRVVVERFVREARVLMRLSSPNVGRLLDVGNLEARRGGLPYLVLEYLQGTDLDRVITARGPVGFQQAFSWIADACDGVAAAHHLGVVHRDLKPSNVFLAQGLRDSVPVVKVLDFGVAFAEASSPTEASQLTVVGTTVGSPAYMAPEQMMSPGDVDARSDVWSMGALLYRVVTGKAPFQGQSELELFANVMTREPSPLETHVTGIPSAAEAVLLRCLRRPPDERFPTMEELASALRAAAG